MRKIFIILSMLVLSSSIVFADVKKDNNELEGIDIPVLMYHMISNDVKNTGVVTAEKFENDLITLKNNGYEPIFLSEIVEYLNGYIELPEKPIVITFDDGYSSNYDYAFPLAKKYNMKITVFMIGWSIGRDTFINSDKPINPHFTWEQAKEMLDSGVVDLQNHTYDLHSPEGQSYGYHKLVAKGVLPFKNEKYTDYKKRFSNDILKLNYLMWQKIEHVPTFIAYPYGAYSNETEKILINLRMGSLTVQSGVRNFKNLSDLQEIPRLNVPNDLKGQALLDKIKSLESK